MKLCCVYYPVKTRWGTWLEAVMYHAANWNEINNWIEQLNNEETSAAVEELKEMLQNQLLKSNVEKIAAVSSDLCCNIKKLEASPSSKTVASDIWLLLSGTVQLLKDANLPSTKLSSYLDGRHPAVRLWKTVQDFDPNRCMSFSINTEVSNFSEDDIPRAEVATYNALLNSHQVQPEPILFWKRSARDMPILSKVALKALSFPAASSADVERSFSTMKRLFTPIRNRLSNENLSVHMRLSFNNVDPDELSEFNTGESDPGDNSDND